MGRFCSTFAVVAIFSAATLAALVIFLIRAPFHRVQKEAQ